MQYLNEITPKSREHPLGEPEQLKSLVQDLAAAIVSSANDLEGVWRITNRVYDRWVTAPWVYEQRTPSGKTSEHQQEQELGLSA
jgi:hypothetical protein